jgi:protein involved in sex pheromone biosynthesis
MKTYKQFIDQLLEDITRSLTQEQQNKIREIRKSKGARAAQEYLSQLRSRRIRNLSPEDQERAIKRQQPQTRLRPGEFLTFDKEKNKWVSNLS